MNLFSSAIWAEALKIRRSKVPLLTAIGFSIAPLVGGLFMVILKDPEAARSMGLISTKAQLVGGTADWVTFFGFIAQAAAIGGALVFAIVTAWVFGREFSDHTAKDLLALPTSREAIVGARFIVIAAWTTLLSLFIFLVGLIVGSLVDIPGWSTPLLRTAFGDVMGSALLTIALLPFVALLASVQGADICQRSAGRFSASFLPKLQQPPVGAIVSPGPSPPYSAERQVGARILWERTAITL